jgi:DNA helicase-2/ATP-dependent DNA helicase PcrA
VQLSREQLVVVEAPLGNQCIIACAGSGKTTVLSRRIAHLLNEGLIAAQGTVAITFTTLAADRLTVALGGILKDPLWTAQMFVGTIHSFGLTLLKLVAPDTADTLRVINEAQQFALLHRHWDDWGMATLMLPAGKSDTIEALLATFDVVKLESIEQEVLRVRQPELARVFTNYTEALATLEYADFADLVSRITRRLAQEPSLRDQLANRYRWLFIDEYQDVDPLQERLFRLLSGGRNLVVVGDDDQSIYQFRGTDVRNLIEFPDRTPGTFKATLASNFRCRANILHAASAVIGENTVRVPKDMKATRPGGRVYCEGFHSSEDEAAFVVETIQALVKQGHIEGYRDVGILFRSVASSGQAVIDAMRDHRIPYITKGDRGLFRRPEAATTLAALEFLAKDPLEAAMLRILAPLFSVPDTVDADERELATMTTPQLRGVGVPADAIPLLRQLLAIKARYEAQRYGSLVELVIDVLAALQLFHTDDPSALYNLAAITQAVADFDEVYNTRKLHLLCAYLQTYSTRTLDEATPVDADIDAVNVLTIHQAKGLEFAAVFCPTLVSGRFPVLNSSRRWLLDDALFDAPRYRTGLEDERRLFYVATTRARDMLYLSYAARLPDVKKPKRPSMFYDRVARLSAPMPEGTITADSSYRTGERALVTSYSAIEYYLTCPYRYLLLREYGVATPTSPFFEYGQSLHRALRILHERHAKGTELSLDVISEVWARCFRMRYNVPRYVVERKRSAGLKTLNDYIASARSWLDDAMATEADFQHRTSGAVLRGRVDLVVRKPNGSCCIVDFKTGEQHEYLRTELQLQTYSLAVREQFRWPVDQAVVHYIEQHTNVSYDVSDAWLADGKKSLASAIGGIRARQFAATPGKQCQRCEVRKVCRYAFK